MKYYVIHKLKKLKSILYKLFYKSVCLLTPIDNKKIVFCCHLGRSGINCNPKYILAEIKKQKLPFKFVWICKKEFMDQDEFPDVEFVDYNNLLQKIKTLASARIWIENIYKIREYRSGLFKKKGQFYLNTWHGSLGIKKMYYDATTFIYSDKYTQALNSNFRDCDLLISDSEFEEKVFRSAFRYKGKIERTGHPRNDVFFQDNENIKNKLRKKYNISKDKKTLLYVPSFRESLKADCYNIDYNKLKVSLKERFGGEWIIMTRFHPTNMNKPDKILENCSAELDVSYHPDIQELLVLADVAISDYSSCMFDFMLQKKPCFIYATDIADYNIERGFYYPLEETPFPIAVNNLELNRNILNFDFEKYNIDCDKFLKEKDALEDGFASKRVVEIIKEVVKNG